MLVCGALAAACALMLGPARAAPPTRSLPEGVAHVEVTAPSLIARGDIFTVRVVVAPADGWSLVAAATLVPKDGAPPLRLHPPSVANQDADLTFELPLSIERADVRTLPLRATLAACRSDQCFMVGFDVIVPVEVVTGATPSALLTTLVEKRLAAQHEALVQCFYSALPQAPSALTTSVLAYANGGAIAVRAPAGGDAIAQTAASCVQTAVGDLFLSSQTSEVELRLDLERVRQPSDNFRGRRGDVCAVGEAMRQESPWLELPAPAPCGRGLRCCGGGAAGSSATCMAVARCPLLP